MSSSYAVQKNIDQNQIYKNLRCLVCQGQSISDSNSDFAQTIKLVVKDLIKQGKSEREIYTFMADKYGDWIVYKPQLNKQNFVLWVLPYVVFIGGGLIIFSIIRKKRINVSRSQKVIDISPVIDEPMNPTSFQDIKDGLCRWPLGEPEEIDFKFCGRNTNEGFVYCQAHHKQAYQPLSKVRERKKIKKKFRIT